jgi:predicted DCC family thiol-disulfide oxidoreductase YuxK
LIAMRKEVPVLLADSECAICNRSVKFIREHQKKNQKILFRSLFSDEGKKYLRQYGLPENYRESLVYIEKDRAYLRSDAALRVTRKMRGLFPVLYVFIIIPRKVRDFFYNLIARHRHRIPGNE